MLEWPAITTTRLHLRVARTSDLPTCIGTIALVPGKAPTTWWLSYWLSPSLWHQGLAQESVGALM